MANPFASEVVVPKGYLAEMGSPDFKIRERAQGQLLNWGRKQPAESKNAIFQYFQNATDPEVRERCLDVLRELVSDDYMTEGDGYIGVALAWKDELVLAPGEKKARKAVRVNQVMANTPGHLSGLMANDLIIKLEGEGWKDGDARPMFQEKIKEMRPGSIANVVVIRDEEQVEIKIKLSRRPLMADAPMHDQKIDFAEAELLAREAHFQQWLSQKKLEK